MSKKREEEIDTIGVEQAGNERKWDQPVTVYVAGQRIEYEVRRVRTNRWLPGVVVKIGPKRIVILLDGTSHTRNTLERYLRPEGGVEP